jgi:hypothetical protein
MALPIGPLRVIINTDAPYFIHIAVTPETTIVWTITGGEIVTGQGTPQILVHWNTIGQGKVEVTVTGPGQEETDSITVIIDPDM